MHTETKRKKLMEYTINTRISTKVNNTTALTALKADIRKYNVMTSDEEIAAFDALKAAKSEEERIYLKRKIANANLRFVLSVAQKYSSDGDKVAELVSIGTIGLYRAIDTFDVTKGFKFISHAIHWIRAEFCDYFRTDANFVRRSNNAIIGTKDKRVAERFLQTEQREPTEDELIEALEKEYGIEVKNRLDVVRVRTDFISESMNSDDDSTVEDSGEFATATASHNDYEYEIEREAQKALVAKVMSRLTIREQEIISRYFGIGREEQDASVIAGEFGLTEERVRQLVVNEIPKKMRRIMGVA